MMENNLVVLGLLNERPMHGYQIMQEIRARLMDIWAKINISSVYNTLTSLENRGLISIKKEQVGNMPERKVYSITGTGTKRLKSLAREELSKIEKGNKIAFWLAVGFIQNLTPEEAKTYLTKRIGKLEGLLEIVGNLYKKCKGDIPFNWLHIIENNIGHLQLDYNETKRLIKSIGRVANWEKGGTYEDTSSIAVCSAIASK